MKAQLLYIFLFALFAEILESVGTVCNENNDSDKNGTTIYPSNPQWNIIVSQDNCGSSTSNYRVQRIVGGTETPIEQSPWQVAIVNKAEKSLLRGGSIISKYHVLSTANFINSTAEDLEEETTSKYLVLAGSSKLGEGIEFAILKIIVHDKYSHEHKRNDIALVMIEGMFEWSATISPICLPEPTTNYNEGRPCRITGWGKTNSSNTHTETVLNGAEVKIVSTADCKRENDKHFLISEGMFCAGDYEQGGIDGCRGDSGGPIACTEQGKSVLFGVSSWGMGCARKHYPGVYTKVAEYISWIEKMAEESILWKIQQDKLLNNC